MADWRHLGTRGAVIMVGRMLAVLTDIDLWREAEESL